MTSTVISDGSMNSFNRINIIINDVVIGHTYRSVTIVNSCKMEHRYTPQLNTYYMAVITYMHVKLHNMQLVNHRSACGIQ